MQFPVMTPPPVTPPPAGDDASIPIMMSAEYPEYPDSEIHGVMAEEVGIPCDYYWWGR